jgi:hypothetical protein
MSFNVEVITSKERKNTRSKKLPTGLGGYGNMKNRLCILLALVPCAAVAEQARLAEFPQADIGTAPFSRLVGAPRVNPPPPVGGAGQKSPANIGIFTTEIPFPVAAPPAAATVRAGSQRTNLSAAMGEEFRYDPADYAAPGGASQAIDGSITKLEPFNVTGSNERKTADGIEAMERMEEFETFHAATGGRMASASWGTFRIELGLWRHEDLIPVPSHFGPPVLVVDLVHISW